MFLGNIIINSGKQLTTPAIVLNGNDLTNRLDSFQTKTDMATYITSGSPVFTGAPKISIGGLNYDITTQPWVGGWFQASSLTVQKQIGLYNFSVVRSPGYATGSFDISFPAHPAGGSYMIIFYTQVIEWCSCFVWIWWYYKCYRIYC